MTIESIDVAKVAVELAMSSREEEKEIIDRLETKGFKGVAVDIGGDLLKSIPKIIERAIVASKKTGVIKDTHVHEGAVAGATREAISQIDSKAIGLNFGGKLGIARSGEHMVVCMFISIGLLYLDDLAISIGHRSIPM